MKGYGKSYDGRIAGYNETTKKYKVEWTKENAFTWIEEKDIEPE